MPLEELLTETERLRYEKFGTMVECCAIVNVKSGRCAMNCRFCAQSGHYRTEAAVFPLVSKETMRDATLTRWSEGICRIGWVASGCAVTDDECNRIADAAESTTSLQPPGASLCTSLGQLDATALKRLKSAGVRRYHHNLETSEQFYPAICTTQRWQDRRATVERARDAGLEVCSGCLFGLGETWDDRLALTAVLRELAVDCVPINFFNPIPGTPLGDRPSLAADEALRIVAMLRLALPEASLRICGGRPVTLGDRQGDLFRAGADALMTGNYLTTSGMGWSDDRELLARSGMRATAGAGRCGDIVVK